MAITSLNHIVGGVSRSVRDEQPAHFLFKIESFSTLVKDNIDKLESSDFEVGGYKWGLCLYPSGNGETNGSGHISLYLVIKEADRLPHGWEVNVQFKLFVYDHIRDKYLTIQDSGGKTRRFRVSKTKWGFSQLLPLCDFMKASNGYLLEDSCVFGAEIFIIKYTGQGECISLVKPKKKIHTWKINNFSAIQTVSLDSKDFTVEERKWKLVVYPRGNRMVKGEYLSLYLSLADSVKLGPSEKQYASYKLRIRDQVQSKHREFKVSSWFSAAAKSFGFSKFINLRNVKDSSNGYIVMDSMVVQVEFTVVSVLKKFP